MHLFHALNDFLQTHASVFNGSSSLTMAALQEAINVRGVLPLPNGRLLCRVPFVTDESIYS